jgi:endonuclease III
MSTPTQIKKIFQIFAENNPEPKTELIYQSPFELLIAVILSAQATDLSVNRATKRLFHNAATAQAMLDYGLESLKADIKTIGLFNSKAKNIIKTCEILVQEHAGLVPSTREQLEKLPGVGRKTANVLLNTLFGEPTIAVDTHIFRVAHRLGLSSGKTPEKVEQDLLRCIPKKYLLHAHHWLVLHGRYICQARKPKCAVCPIKKSCQSAKKL